MEKEKKLVIYGAWCKGCGICVEFCPQKALLLSGGKVELDADAGCSLCGLCELRCPDYAIYLESTGEEDEADA